MSWTKVDYDPTDFGNRRHIGPSPAEMNDMLSVVGASSLDALIDETVPASIRQEKPLQWPALSEAELIAHMRAIGAKNKVMTSMIGQGYYNTHTPPAIQRNVLENPAWYTAYTPYQPEIAQGRLEALLNFQTMVADLTGLEVSNASLLDEATACAEAMVMAQRVAKSKATAFFIDQDCHPQNIAVMQTRAAPLGIELIIGDPASIDASAVFGGIFQYPGTFGDLVDPSDAIKALHAEKAIAILATDLLALTVIKEPGAMDADIAVGSAQRFGVPLGYGGPHAAFMACREAYKRAIPGRLVGVSIDSRGQKAYRLALQTREQHIRREKATSNVCTAQALLAVMASFFAVFHGPIGLTAIAQRVHLNTVRLAASLAAGGYRPLNATFFDTITVQVGDKQNRIMAASVARGINLRSVGQDRIAISVDETTTPDIIENVCRSFGVLFAGPQSVPAIPDGLLRRSEFLTHPIFHMNRAESEMMRYMRRLSDRDLALDRAMIPLGSCTMKLNAAVEMMPITWPEFGALHPFAPADQAEGYAEMLEDLSA
ncbi:MAG: glycine dehydrogenase, partial [Paracoccaceae bacterium]